jgi:subtilisin family serine protease
MGRYERMNRWLLVVGVLLLGLLSMPVAAGPVRLQAQVDDAVWKSVEDSGEAEVLILLRPQADLSGAAGLPTKEAKGRYAYERLRAVAEASQRGLQAMLDAQQSGYRPFYLVNALQVHVDPSLMQKLAARPEVDRIVLNPSTKGVPDLGRLPLSSRATQAIQANLLRVRADDVWALGYTGQGAVVAGQDTGYDWDHPALKNQYRGWNGTAADHNYSWHDAIHQDDPHTLPGNPCGFDSLEPCDDLSHGTHTMGIMVGDDGAGHQIGIAPGAQWIGCRNMEQGWGTPASYLECFEFFLAPYPVGGTPVEGDPSLAPDVVNNSWACPPSEGCDQVHIALMELAVEVLRHAGILVVASTGNYGPGCSSVLYPPAIYQQSLSVGNFDHETGEISPSSSRGPVTYHGFTYTKPDLAAPGVGIVSSLRGGSYGTMSGTSMAAPHVAGGVALLLSASPAYRGQVDAIKDLLTRSADSMTTTQGCGGDGPADVPNNTWGWGVLDVFAAVKAATAGTLQGTVTDAEDGGPIAGASVTARLGAQPEIEAAIATDATGKYTLTLAAGIYDLTVEVKGYFPQTIARIAVIRDEVVTQDFALTPWLRVYLPLVSNER